MSAEENIPPSPGTRQIDRTKAALDPASAPLDGRMPEQLATDARKFADDLAYWTNRNQVATNVQWSNFFPDLESRGQEAAEKEAQQHAQKGLFLTFLKLYKHAQNDLNDLTARHLNFQYRDVLRLIPEPARPDKAHLVLNLKKAVTEARVPLGTKFQTDDNLTYESTEEVFLRQTELAHIRTIHVDPDQKSVRAAPIANSLDGLGEDLDESDPSWHPFGSNRDLPAAECGFALSSPILLLHEGERSITVTLKLNFASTPPTKEKLETYFENDLETHLSTAEEWLPASAPSATISGSSGNRRTVKLVYALSTEEPAITAYDPTILPGGYDTVAPIIKWTCLKIGDREVSIALSEAAFEEVQIKVSVDHMKDLDLENDHGKIDPAKPFYPFGPLAPIGSSFYLGAEEALNKKVTSASLTIDWKNPPEKFTERYAAYPNASTRTNASFTAQFQILKNGRFDDLTSEPKQLFDSVNAAARVVIDSNDSRLGNQKLAMSAFHKKFSRLVKQAKIELPFSRVSISRPISTLQKKPALQFRSAVRLPLQPFRAKLRASTQKGFLRLKLNKDFGQKEYPELFSSTVAHNSVPANSANQRLVPNPPYLPEIDKITLSYHAETKFIAPTTTNKGAFQSREIRLFHLDAFGQREEHTYIKNKVEAEDTAITLLPQREIEGQLLLGFSSLGAGESISLLFQVKNGTADPSTTRRDLKWSFLSSNHWREFQDEEVLMDTTEGFLTSGIVRLLIPRSANQSNTLLEPDFLWIRARVDEQTEATCRLLNIHPNAVSATLTNPSEAAHLDAGLPAESIVATSTTLRGVKEVTQPYLTTGGSAEEEDPDFRTRISELLRHRGRASSAWDYEHLVLQAFPHLFKAQALNHTDRNLNRAPGHVTLVVLPDASTTESATLLTPQVDAATLSQVNDFLSHISSDFVTAEAINPSFESIHVTFKVSFRPGHPYNSYREILRQDIQNHLAPWTTGASTSVDFGRHLYRSALIAFIDSLPYVDFLTELKLFHRQHGKAQAESVLVAKASRPGAVLTPTGTHIISPAS